ncbi:hypothetical protein L218DRAFT_947877 [Marasmius fiardii PR-910]|nr:hypothetical protein L218DRAFT_947877 [Marasmius fiardii PR-910]
MRFATVAITFSVVAFVSANPLAGHQTPGRGTSCTHWRRASLDFTLAARTLTVLYISGPGGVTAIGREPRGETARDGEIYTAIMIEANTECVLFEVKFYSQMPFVSPSIVRLALTGNVLLTFSGTRKKRPE